MAPGGRDRKGKEIVQESEAHNVRGLADIVQGKRGRPAGQPVRHVEAEVEQEVEQITQRVGGMQLIISQFQELRPPKLFGNESGEKAAGWLKSINHLFNLLEYSQDVRLNMAIYQLKDRAQLWWETTEEALKEAGKFITWDVFRAKFTQEYAPPSYYSAKEEEFNQLVQGNKSVVEYASQFSALLPYVPHVARNDQSKLSRFLHGLQRTIHTLVLSGSPNTYAQAVEQAKKLEASLLRGEPQPVPVAVPQGAGSSTPMPMGLPLYQPQQSYQQSKQQRFKPRGQQFKNRSQSSSSSSGSTLVGSVGSSSDVFCDCCGGRHFSTQCVGVQGSCYICGQIGHFTKVCPNAKKQQFQPQQFGQTPRGSAFRPYAPTQSFQQSIYPPPPRGPVQQPFPGPQRAQVHALTQDQAHDSPGGVIADYPGGFDASGGASASGAP